MSGQVAAQTITISPKTGNVIAAASYSSEAHQAGYGGAWVHNQLPMDLFTSDEGTLTSDGLLSKHANNIAPDGNGFMVVSGDYSSGAVNHMTLSLPKGYRFTGYAMVLSYASSGNDKATCTFKETDKSFSSSYASVKINTDSKSVKLSRTASKGSANQMGNVLYFIQDITSGTSYVKIESFEISFECDQSFSATVRPASAFTTGVDCTAFAFGTERVDLGSITWSNGNQGSNYSFRYNYNDVKDLDANFMLYDNDGIAKGSASTSTKKEGHIKATNINGGLHYALQNDTYYLETPTDAVTQNNNLIPVGYRITGAKLHYYANITTPSPALGKSFYITDGSGKYMNASLQFTTTPVVWQSDSQGYVWTTGSNGTTVYLSQESSGLGGSTHTLKTMTSKTTTFELDDTGLYYKGTFTHYVCKDGTLGTTKFDTNDVATILSAEPSTGSFTLNLYGTDGSTVAKTVTADATNNSGTLEVTGLNNDAIKFEVKDLTGTAAYVYAELTLEALNPYISKMDVVATTSGGDATLAQSYLADDFTIGDDGKVSFSVPDNFASSGVKLSFDNLTSKRADETYGPLATDGNARYHFVKSTYYNTINENLQEHRSDAADHTYTDKITVSVVGNQQFKVNNSDDFKVGTGQSSTTYSYTESRYTNSAYTTQGGIWDEVSLTRDNKTKDCYLVTCDETRYNLAPTTTPRHAFYAYYNTSVTLNIADYEPQLTYVKVYDSAMLQTGLDQNAYYGVKVGAKMKNSGTAVADGTGYLFAKQILDQINADANNEGCPKDASHVLYIDASNLTTVLSSATQSDTYGKIELIQDAIGKNAMIYLPAGVTYTLKNIASKTTSGDFKAENNIILTDKLPFFAPYDIRVDAHNYTEYTRQVTYDYGKSNYVTLVLPYTIDLTEQDGQKGVHTNFQGGSSFQFYNMQLTNAISDVTGKDDYNYQVTGHFSPVEGMATESNKPYLVYILSPEENADENTNIVVRQNGANIMKTPTDAQGLGTLINGETASGKIGSSDVTFTPHGTLNGVQLDGNSSTYFYFAKNKFVSSANLPANDKAVYIMPFRTYYDYTGTQNAKYMSISLEPNGDATGIDTPAAAVNTGCRIIAGDGAITVIATENGKQAVRNMSGQTIADLQMKAGESRRVSLPAGIYLVGSQKVLVR